MYSNIYTIIPFSIDTKHSNIVSTMESGVKTILKIFVHVVHGWPPGVKRLKILVFGIKILKSKPCF